MSSALRSVTQYTQTHFQYYELYYLIRGTTTWLQIGLPCRPMAHNLYFMQVFCLDPLFYHLLLYSYRSIIMNLSVVPAHCHLDLVVALYRNKILYPKKTKKKNKLYISTLNYFSFLLLLFCEFVLYCLQNAYCNSPENKDSEF